MKFSKEKFGEFKSYIQKHQLEEITHFIKMSDSKDLHSFITYLAKKHTVKLFSIIPEEMAAQLLCGALDNHLMDYVLLKLKRPQAAKILKYVPSDVLVDTFRALKPKVVKNILQHFEPEMREEVKGLIKYEDDTAGGLMITEYLEYYSHQTTNDIRKDLEKNAETYKNYDVQYTYIVNKNKKLLGVIPLRELFFSSKNTLLIEILHKKIITIPIISNIEQIRNYFNDHSYLAFPVVDENHKLLGVLKRDSVEHFLKRETEQEFLKLTGIMGGEESHSMPIPLRSAKRLSWLSINILLNFMAASVIIFYQDTLAQAITLAVFLPIISDMSGCSGNQSVAVTLRELALGWLQPKEIFRVLIKESILGLLNGIVLGCIIALIAFFWKENIYLGMVVGTALACNTVIAVCLGSAIPIVLKLFKIDPAIASGPLLTTITDMVGFLLVFVFATQFLHQLT